MKAKLPTWKEVLGVVAMLAGAGATQIGSTGSSAPVAILVGGILLAVERAAQAYEHRTRSQAPAPGTTQSAA